MKGTKKMKIMDFRIIKQGIRKSYPFPLYVCLKVLVMKSCESNTNINKNNGKRINIFCMNDNLKAKPLAHILNFHISFFISKLKQSQSKVLHFMGNTICVVEAYPIP